MVSRISLAAVGIFLLAASSSTLAQTLPAPAPYSHLNISGDARGFWLFDQETGNVYRYDITGHKTKQRFIGSVTEPGKPLSPVPTAYNPADIPRSQRRALAGEVLQELRILAAAVDQWAIENNKAGGSQPTIADLVPYLSPTSRFRYFMAQGKCQDSLGNRLTIPAVDGLPSFSRATFDYFASVTSEDFWIPFPVTE